MEATAIKEIGEKWRRKKSDGGIKTEIENEVGRCKWTSLVVLFLFPQTTLLIHARRTYKSVKIQYKRKVENGNATLL